MRVLHEDGKSDVETSPHRVLHVTRSLGKRQEKKKIEKARERESKRSASAAGQQCGYTREIPREALRREAWEREKNKKSTCWPSVRFFFGTLQMQVVAKFWSADWMQRRQQSFSYPAFFHFAISFASAYPSLRQYSYNSSAKRKKGRPDTRSLREKERGKERERASKT